MRGALVHEHSSVLARLWPRGCAPADLLPSLLAAQCGACAAVAALRCQLRRPCCVQHRRAGCTAWMHMLCTLRKPVVHRSPSVHIAMARRKFLQVPASSSRW